MRFEHPLDPRDQPLAQANREMRAPAKGKPLGVENRAAFEARKSSITAPDHVTATPATVGGVPGFWCRPAKAMPNAAILFLHGGGFSMGSARAFTNFAGQLAARAGTDTFVADYRLAPEHQFPAGLNDAIAAYKGLAEQRPGRVAIAGDSAGANLTLAVLARMSDAEHAATLRPAAAAVMSPWTDLTLASDSYNTRADADPVFTRDVLQQVANNYLGVADPKHPLASPLFGDPKGLPPIRIDIGDDEVLLD